MGWEQTSKSIHNSFVFLEGFNFLSNTPIKVIWLFSLSIWMIYSLQGMMSKLDYLRIVNYFLGIEVAYS